MNMTLRCIAAACFTLTQLYAEITPANAEAQPKALKVLSVGNSFSANAHKYLKEIVAAAGDKITLQNAYIGGCSFERHMKHAKAYEANPEDPEGSPYGFYKKDGKVVGKATSLKALLTKEEWDVITIQQSSPLSFKPESFAVASDLITYIRKYAPKSEIVVHQTWAYRPDRTNFWAQSKIDEKIMYKLLKKNYDDLAKANNFRLIPCGDAFELSKLDKDWGPYDPVAKTHSLYNDDCYHANFAGEYLLGCVWYEFLYGKSSLGNKFHPEKLTDDEAKVLQRIAHLAIESRKALVDQ